VAHTITLLQDQVFGEIQRSYDNALPQERESAEKKVFMQDLINESIEHEDWCLLVDKSIRFLVDWLNRTREEVKDGEKTASKAALDLQELFETYGTKKQVEDLHKELIQEARNNYSPLVAGLEI
jgi:hypothetical protein